MPASVFYDFSDATERSTPRRNGDVTVYLPSKANTTASGHLARKSGNELLSPFFADRALGRSSLSLSWFWAHYASYKDIAGKARLVDCMCVGPSHVGCTWTPC